MVNASWCCQFQLSRLFAVCIIVFDKETLLTQSVSFGHNTLLIKHDHVTLWCFVLLLKLVAFLIKLTVL